MREKRDDREKERETRREAVMVKKTAERKRERPGERE